ncbi:hypothetical protein FHS14_000368 [Paenibacillus baekrokdamisoli]|nr:hypothetical protein [Paenibacillus baekrokdamisoli]
MSKYELNKVGTEAGFRLAPGRALDVTVFSQLELAW